MDCQYGHHYFLKKQGKNKQVRLQDTKKIGCQAKIKIKSILHTLPRIFITKTEPEFMTTKTASGRGIGTTQAGSGKW